MRKRTRFLLAGLVLFTGAGIALVLILAATGPADRRTIDRVNAQVEAGEVMTLADAEVLFGQPPNAPLSWSLIPNDRPPMARQRGWRAWESVDGVAIVWLDERDQVLGGSYRRYEREGLMARLRRWLRL